MTLFLTAKETVSQVTTGQEWRRDKERTGSEMSTAVEAEILKKKVIFVISNNSIGNIQRYKIEYQTWVKLIPHANFMSLAQSSVGLISVQIYDHILQNNHSVLSICKVMKAVFLFEALRSPDFTLSSFHT